VGIEAAFPADVDNAAVRIASFVRETPLEFSELLSNRTGCRVYLKLENQQHTSSFKVRGALNALLSLDDAHRARGVVAASSGNHGAGDFPSCLQFASSSAELGLSRQAPDSDH
jgi:threonine dehydratase